MTLLDFMPSSQANASSCGSWSDFLKAHIDRDWRPKEWNFDLWYFRCDVSNRRTKAFVCPTPACAVPTPVQGRMCSHCLNIVGKTADMNASDQRKALTDSINRARGVLVGACQVERGEQQCARVVVAHGLCSAHYELFRKHLKRSGISLKDFLSNQIGRPYGPKPICAVAACGRQIARSPRELCLVHGKKFRDSALSFDEWLSTATPAYVPGNFSLMGSNPQLRLEILFALQCEDRDNMVLSPFVMSMLNHGLARSEGADSLVDKKSFALIMRTMTANAHLPALLRRLNRHLRVLHAEYSGVDLASNDEWDPTMMDLGITPDQERRYRNNGLTRSRALMTPIDFSVIKQVWLRDLAKNWARETSPTMTQLRRTIRMLTLISSVLSSRRDGSDRTTASVKDLSRFMRKLDALPSQKGTQTSYGLRNTYFLQIRRFIKESREAGFMADVGVSFAFTSGHKLTRTAEGEQGSEEPVPTRLMRQIVKGLESCRVENVARGTDWTPESQSKALYAALRIAIDTGRRPGEVVSLRVGCVIAKTSTANRPIIPSSSDVRQPGVSGISNNRAHDADTANTQYYLEYDNQKGKRANRKLPITVQTAKAILEWQSYRLRLPLSKNFDEWLFPSTAVAAANNKGPLSTNVLASALNRVVASLSSRDSDVEDFENGGFLPYRKRIEVYTFRHAYAQRLADNRVPVDVLRELMDHKSIDTTMGYYVVSSQRKREAIATVAHLTFDRHGNSAPMETSTAYDLASVAVSFGNCLDPANVQAEGDGCKIREQCAGCDLFRADPSYLPDLEEHLVSLRGNLNLVEGSAGVATWVLDALRHELQAFAHLVKAIKAKVAQMSDLQKSQIDDATTALRRMRGGRPGIHIAPKDEQ